MKIVSKKSLKKTEKEEAPADLEEEEKEAIECSICFEDDTEDDKMISLSCDKKHIFHIACIKKWANSDRSAANTCPLCRQKYDCYKQLNEVNDHRPCRWLRKKGS